MTCSKSLRPSLNGGSRLERRQPDGLRLLLYPTAVAEMKHTTYTSFYKLASLCLRIFVEVSALSVALLNTW